MSVRTLAIGDVHGCDLALRALCEGLELQRDDRLILLGDLVDRGPGTREVLDYVLQLEQQCQLTCIRGNHEEVMLEARSSRAMFRNWLMIGGREALDSYNEDIHQIPESHWIFLESTIDFYETDTEIFLHANLEPGVALTDQKVYWLRWQHLTGMEFPHESGKRIICGHTNQKSGRPLVIPGWVCIDTGACRGNPLTCLHVETNTIYQATLDGEFLAPRPL